MTPFRAVGHRRGVLAHALAAPQRLHADELHRVVEEAGEDAHRVGAAAHARLDHVRQIAGHLHELLARLHAHDLLEVAHHERERMRADDGADAVDGVLVVGEVGLERRVHGLLERLQPVRDRHDGRAEELHAAHVGRLLLDVHHAHVDLAREAEVRGGRGERDAVLAGAGLGDELLLAHVLGQQALAHAVVELVRAGVVEVLALEVDLRAAVGEREGARVVDRRRPALEVLAQVAQLGDEGGVVLDLVVRLGRSRRRAPRAAGGRYCPPYLPKNPASSGTARRLAACSASASWTVACSAMMLTPALVA